MSFSIPGADAPVSVKDNDGIFPKFYLRAVQDGAASSKEGRPIFKDVEWVDILIAGDKTTCRSTQVTDQHRERFSAHYQAWKQNLQVSPVGTPLEQWPAMTPSQVEELKALRIYTVEQLAGMSDSGLQAIGLGGRSLSEKAKAYLVAAKSTADAQRYAQDNENLRSRVEQLEKLLAQASGLDPEQFKELLTKPKTKAKKAEAP